MKALMGDRGPEPLPAAGHWWRKIVFLAETIEIKELLLWADRYYLYGDAPLAFRLLLIDFLNSLVRGVSYRRRKNRMITEKTEESLLFCFKKFCEEVGGFGGLRKDLERLAEGYDRALMASNCKNRLAPYGKLVEEAFGCGAEGIVDCFTALAGTGRVQSRPFKLSSFMIHPGPQIPKGFLDAVSLEIPKAGQDRGPRSGYAEKPALLIDGIYFCFAPYLVLPRVFDVVEGAVRSLGSDWKVKWDEIANPAPVEKSSKSDGPGQTAPLGAGQEPIQPPGAIAEPGRTPSGRHEPLQPPDDAEEQPDYPRDILMEFEEFAPPPESGYPAGGPDGKAEEGGSEDEIPTSIQPTLFSQPLEEMRSGAGGRTLGVICPRPEGEPQPMPALGIKPQGESAPRPEIEAAVEAHPEPEATEEARPETEAAGESRLEIEAGGEARPEPEAAVEARPEPEATEEARPEAATAGEPRPEIEAGGEAHPEPEAGGEAHPEPEATEEARPETEAAGEPRPEIEAGGEAQPEPEAGGEAHPEPEAAGEPRPKPEAAVEPRPAIEAGGEARPEPEVAGEPCPEIEAGGEERPESEATVEAHPKSEATEEARPEAEAAGEPLPEPEVAGEPCPEIEAGGEARPEAEAAGEPLPEPEAAGEARPEPEAAGEAQQEPLSDGRSPDAQDQGGSIDLAKIIPGEDENGKAVGRIIQQMGEDKAASLGKKLGEAIAAWKVDGKDKLFSEVGSGLSFCVANPSQDAVARMEMENALGALMLASERTKWLALVVKPSMEGLRTEVLRIGKDVFEPWRWKIVRQMGWKLYLRIKDEKSI